MFIFVNKMANRYFQKMKEQNPDLPTRIGVYWSDEEETRLLQLLHEEKTHEEIGRILERTSGAITARIKHIAREMYDKGISNLDIMNITKLSNEDVIEVIEKHNSRKIDKEKKKEEKFMSSPPKSSATLVTIPTSDLMQMKLLLFEIRDLLKVLSQK